MKYTRRLRDARNNEFTHPALRSKTLGREQTSSLVDKLPVCRGVIESVPFLPSRRAEASRWIQITLRGEWPRRPRQVFAECSQGRPTAILGCPQPSGAARKFLKTRTP